MSLLTRCLLFALLVCLTGAAKAEQSEPFWAKECGAVIDSPTAMEHSTQALSGHVTAHYYSGRLAGRTYSVVCVIDAGLKVSDPEAGLDAYRDGELQDDPDNLIAEHSVRLGSWPGRDIRCKSGSGEVRLRVYLMPPEALIVKVEGSSGDIASPTTEMYLSSLRLGLK